MVIAEISSFQLETIETFRPATAVLLNITEDHLDRYASFADYMAAKMRIFENQTHVDDAVISKEIEGMDALAARRITSRRARRLEEGAFLEDGFLRVRLGGTTFSYRRDLSPLVGVHNTENLLCALLTAHLYGIGRRDNREDPAGFKGLPHRVEFVQRGRGRQVLQRLEGDERRCGEKGPGGHGRGRSPHSRRQGQGGELRAHRPLRGPS